MNVNVMASAVFVLATATANVLQKKAMSAAAASGGMSAQVLRRVLLSPHLWGGLVAWAVALAMYLLLLARLPLNVATSIAALNFVAVLLAARFVVGEPIPPLRYLGFACIVLGLYVVSLTQRGAR